MVPQPHWLNISRLPVILAAVGVLLGGLWLLERSDQQARDTIRKHHLEDIERSLFFARSVHGTYPPYDQPTWCGQLNAPQNTAVRAEVEAVLRAQNKTYANAAKPFPADPRASAGVDYFYWKRSPALFELYAILEASPTGERRTAGCDNAPDRAYDYGLLSAFREDRVTLTP